MPATASNMYKKIEPIKKVAKYLQLIQQIFSDRLTLLKFN